VQTIHQINARKDAKKAQEPRLDVSEGRRSECEPVDVPVRFGREGAEGEAFLRAEGEATRQRGDAGQYGRGVSIDIGIIAFVAIPFAGIGDKGALTGRTEAGALARASQGGIFAIGKVLEMGGGVVDGRNGKRHGRGADNTTVHALVLVGLQALRQKKGTANHQEQCPDDKRESFCCTFHGANNLDSFLNGLTALFCQAQVLC
jgi:hypothetical protein